MCMQVKYMQVKYVKLVKLVERLYFLCMHHYVVAIGKQILSLYTITSLHR